MLRTEAMTAVAGVDGWLTDAEQALLYDQARRVPEGGTIVELGSWQGRSTIMLAAASLAGPRATVYAVDLFAAVGATGDQYAPHLGGDDPDYLARFEANVRDAGVESIVVPIRGETAAAGRSWSGPPIHFLFIDADHSYRGVRDDFLAWAPHCDPGAAVAFHDYYNFDQRGVRRFVDRLIAAGILADVGFAGSILHATLAVTDPGAIARRLRSYPLGLPRLLLRPRPERALRYEMALNQSWYDLDRGARRSALGKAAEAVWWQPLHRQGWRLLAYAAVKPAGGRR